MAHALDSYEMDPEPEYEEQFDASTYWYPHEKCMMVSVAPQVSLTITAADYLSCPEFHAVYTAILAEDKLSAQKVTADKALALKLLTQRYSKYDLPLPKLAELSAAVLNARVLRCRITGGLLYYQHKKHGMLLCIPDVYGSDGVNHRRSIFNEFHATPHSGHHGGTSTYNAIRPRAVRLSRRCDPKDDLSYRIHLQEPP